jgi:hypothetical protein
VDLSRGPDLMDPLSLGFGIRGNIEHAEDPFAPQLMPTTLNLDRVWKVIGTHLRLRPKANLDRFWKVIGAHLRPRL